MGGIAEATVPGMKVSLWFAERLTKDIRPEDFGRKPEGIDANSPAWVFGHLSLYADDVLKMVGREDLMRPDERYTRLFAYQSECLDDPEGTIYPPKEELLARFNERLQAMIDALSETPDEVLRRPNPIESMSDMFPTVGSFAGFMNQHNWMHFGQISTWRRVMGLGPCM